MDLPKVSNISRVHAQVLPLFHSFARSVIATIILPYVAISIISAIRCLALGSPQCAPRRALLMIRESMVFLVNAMCPINSANRRNVNFPRVFCSGVGGVLGMSMRYSIIIWAPADDFSSWWPILGRLSQSL